MKIYNNKMVIESLRLPMFEDIETLAEETRLTEKLVYFLTKENAEGRYITFSIPKKDETKREINAPCMSLKVLQRWVLQNILYKVRVSQYSIGFKKNGQGSPLVQCAERHKNNGVSPKVGWCYNPQLGHPVFMRFVNG